MIPRATYRLQFHRQFTFDDASALAPYLAALGISHVYASPILAARAGSPHGYDVVDHSCVNEELGGEEGLRRFCAVLAKHGLKLVVDIVPNHMAAHADNAWWLDVLEKGEVSPFAMYFDIDWHPGDPLLDGKLLLPALGEPYAEALLNERLSLGFDESLNRLVIRYYEHRFPLRREEYGAFELTGHLDDARIKAATTPDALHRLLERQHYRLCWWRTAADAINWRRFFNINDLIALRVEEPEVFEAVHAKIFSLLAEGLIDGLRIDHVDGLADPAAYCRRLRTRLDGFAPGRRPWLVVEKILGVDESLPGDWLVDGTTGYDFLNDVCALLHDPRGEGPLSEAWQQFSGRMRTFSVEAREARREVAMRQFAAPLAACASAFRLVAASSPSAIDLPARALSRGLVRLLAAMRTYRTYATGNCPYASADFDAALAAARTGATETDLLALRLIEDTLLGRVAETGDAAPDAVRRFNQLASAVAAKAVEDTAFYRYGRLLSRNDVGCSPEAFSLTCEEFHTRMVRRAAAFPHGLLATATHDHKRGEDTRARLAVLSEVPGQWASEAQEWFRINEQLRRRVLDPGDEYQVYQSLVGSWPVMLALDDVGGLAHFADRMETWRVKSLREAKMHSSWSEPDTDYEAASVEFVHALLDPARSRDFLTRLHAFVEWISPAAALNTLVQTVLRCALPGIPDLYQGAELWDFSLVDPDNRSPVDYSTRMSALNEPSAVHDLLTCWKDGRFKQRAIHLLLGLRKRFPALFEHGNYMSLRARGPRADHVLSFARAADNLSLLVMVPLRCAPACLERGMPLTGPGFWQDTEIVCENVVAAGKWRSLLEPDGAYNDTARFSCARLFERLPVAVLINS